VASLLPEFKLGDPAVTAQVQVKHLVCACTGLPRQDFEWIFEFKDATPKTTLASLGTMVPTTKFGETYQYSNPLASAGGYVGGHVAYPDKELGAAYDAAMKARVFGPLGMRSTTFDFATVLRQNHATPHGEDIDGVPRVAPMGPNYAIVPIRPAGGAWSNVRDLARVVQMELANGKIPGGDGKRLVSEASIAARRAPQVSFGERQTYGMGLEVDRTWDLPWVHHGGSMIGFKSDYFFIPEHGIGGVILTNADAGYMLLRPFVRRTLEVLFDGRPEAKEDVATVAKARKAQLRKERERLVVPPDPSAVSKLVPRYHNAALGTLQVLTKDELTFDFGEWKSAVATRKNDDGTTSFVTTTPGVDGFDFVVGERQLVLRDAQHEYVFREKK
jgi:CubicO group peptidase (beta-lactamase class C family)